MEKPFTGLTASVKVGGVLLAYIEGFDLDLEKDIIEILQFGAQYKEKVPAIKDWSASVDGTVALVKNGSQAKLLQAFESGNLLEIGIFLDDNTYFQGNGYVSTFHIDGAPDDKLNLSAEFAGSGATVLTLPEPPAVLATPTGLAWDTSIPGKAKWGAVDNNNGYTVQLYKNGTAQGIETVIAKNTVEYDYTSTITSAGTGNYTFKVIAKGDGTSYTDSEQSDASPVYNYTAD